MIMVNKIRQLAEKEFPRLLREITDPPSVLYAQGNLPTDNAKILTVVGSRACTSYGRDVVEFLIDGLSGHAISIVSGLALGTDGNAHLAALRAGIHTVAVPGSGLARNVLYPRAHVQLAEHILESGGALLSEFEPECPAAPWTFPKRNRIMAGMSDAILLIEAAERSGTLITARLATEYNRELLVVPASIFAHSSKGVHQFLKLGATPVTSPDDILAVLGIQAEERPPEHTLALSPHEREIYTLLQEPMPRDELLEKLSLSVTDANIILSKLELDGIIVEKLGTMRRAHT